MKMENIKLILLAPLVVIGLLSIPALFFAGQFLIVKRLLASRAPAMKWSAAAAYWAAIFVAWRVLYSHGEWLQPYFPLPHLTFAYSIYLLLPLSATACGVSLVGALAFYVRGRAQSSL